MALKPCRECNKVVSDQAEVCPNCGINGPVENLVANLPPPQGRADDIILTMANVVITGTLAKFGGQTFPINSIGSVTLVAPKIAKMIIYAIVLLIVGVTILGNGGGGTGVFFVVSSVMVFLMAFSRKHGLLIRTASGDVRAMEHRDQTILGAVKEAIERAGTMRG
jgi:hypothetical protein